MNKQETLNTSKGKTFGAAAAAALFRDTAL